MRPLCAGLLWICLAFVTGARAATFEAMDFDRLADEAEQIFIGTVDAAIPLALRPRHIVTDFRFVDIELVKGQPPGPTAMVRMLGGTVGDLQLAIPGAPTFRVGQRYLVFIAGNNRVMFPTLGGSQGIFQVRRDWVTGQTQVFDYVGRPVSAASLLDPLATTPKSLAMVPAMSKDAFVGEILMRLGRAR
jgi:hypothetical protein